METSLPTPMTARVSVLPVLPSLSDSGGDGAPGPQLVTWQNGQGIVGLIQWLLDMMSGMI